MSKGKLIVLEGLDGSRAGYTGAEDHLPGLCK